MDSSDDNDNITDKNKKDGFSESEENSTPENRDEDLSYGSSSSSSSCKTHSHEKQPYDNIDDTSHPSFAPEDDQRRRGSVQIDKMMAGETIGKTSMLAEKAWDKNNDKTKQL